MAQINNHPDNITWTSYNIGFPINTPAASTSYYTGQWDTNTYKFVSDEIEYACRFGFTVVQRSSSYIREVQTNRKEMTLRIDDIGFSRYLTINEYLDIFNKGYIKAVAFFSLSLGTNGNGTWVTYHDSRNSDSVAYMYLSNLGWVSGYNEKTYYSMLTNGFNNYNKNTVLTQEEVKTQIMTKLIDNIDTLIDVTSTFTSTSQTNSRTFYLKTTFNKDPNNSNVVNYETMILKTVFNKELSVPYGTDYLIIDRIDRDIV